MWRVSSDGLWSECIGIRSICKYAFKGCEGLVLVDIPSGVTTIGGSAFSGCSSLEDICIPEGITTLEHYVLSSCRSLTNLTIPSTTIIINDYALRGCTSLNNISCRIMEIGKVKASKYGKAGDLKAFEDIAENCTWHVKKGTKVIYEKQSWWKETWEVVEDLGYDVNCDGIIDVADIASIISVMANGENNIDADVNGDGTVDVADIVSVISIMASSARESIIATEKR